MTELPEEKAYERLVIYAGVFQAYIEAIAGIVEAGHVTYTLAGIAPGSETPGKYLSHLDEALEMLPIAESYAKSSLVTLDCKGIRQAIEELQAAARERFPEYAAWIDAKPKQGTEQKE